MVPWDLPFVQPSARLQDFFRKCAFAFFPLFVPRWLTYYLLLPSLCVTPCGSISPHLGPGVSAGAIQNENANLPSLISHHAISLSQVTWIRT